MPIKIMRGCSGFQVLSQGLGREKNLISADDLKAVHLAVDHHYWHYSKKGEQHKAGAVAGCPLCEKMKEGRS